MKKTILCSIMLLIMLFVCIPRTYADAIYLKNGQVMRGRIVEKTEQYLVLKTGEGEAAVKTTIYLEDINRMQSDEEYNESRKFIPTQILKQESPKPWEEDTPFAMPVGPQGEGFPEFYRQGTEAVVPFEAAAGDTKFPSWPGLGISGAAIGSISGYVELPPNFKKSKGDLYVYLMKDAGGNRFSLMAAGGSYQKIEGRSISTSLVPYKIAGVPRGTYKVFAYWDVAAPYVTKKQVRGREVLLGLGLKGDYTGAQSGQVVITAEHPDQVAELDCRQYLTQDRVKATGSEGGLYQVKDIYYRKLVLQGVKIYLVLENFDEEEISLLWFDLFINDEKVPSGVLSLGPLHKGQEKEFDITTAFESYVNEKRKEGINPTESPLRFKVISRESGEVEIEKVLFIL